MAETPPPAVHLGQSCDNCDKMVTIQMQRLTLFTDVEAVVHLQDQSSNQMNYMQQPSETPRTERIKVKSKAAEATLVVVHFGFTKFLHTSVICFKMVACCTPM